MKNFRTSELARSSGAAVHLSRVAALGAGTASRKSTGSKEDEPGPDKVTGPSKCPYCAESTFVLGKDCLQNRYSDYDEFFERSPEFRDREDNYDSASASDDGLVRSALMTGSVCLNGHIMLGAGGYLRGSGKRPVLRSGKGSELEPSNAVSFLLEYSPGKGGMGFEEGVNFIRGLNLDQLIRSESRLSSLLREWPSVQRTGSVFYHALSRYVRLKQAPKSVCELLEGDLAEDFWRIVWRFVIEGKLDLPQCKVLLEDALYAAKLERRRVRIHEALAEMGFSHLVGFPHPKSVNKYILVSMSPTIKQCLFKCLLALYRKLSISDGSLKPPGSEL